MGLIDSINSLKNEVKNNQEQQKRELKEAERKQLIKYQLLSILKIEIQEAQERGEDIRNTYTQEDTIDRVIKNPEISNLINQNFTRYYLLENYNKIINDIEKEIEKEKKEKEQKQKQLEKTQKEIEKEHIKQQKELQKEIEAERIRKAEARKTIIESLKILCMIILSPFLLLLFFVLALANSKNLGK